MFTHCFVSCTSQPSSEKFLYNNVQHVNLRIHDYKHAETKWSYGMNHLYHTPPCTAQRRLTIRMRKNLRKKKRLAIIANLHYFTSWQHFLRGFIPIKDFLLIAFSTNARAIIVTAIIGHIVVFIILPCLTTQFVHC